MSDAERIDRSLGEVEALTRKALRGAGASWATAAEGAYAARQLCVWGIDGCAEVEKLCRTVEHHGAPLVKPVTLTNNWQAASEEMCSICCGLALADMPEQIPEGLAFTRVAAPLLMVPFVSLAAKSLGAPIGVSWGQNRVVCDADGISASGNLEAHVADVSLELDASDRVEAVHHARAWPTTDCWATLEKMASKTYAPATEESRRKGAG